MGSMTVGTDCGSVRSGGYCFSMHTFLIRQEWLRAVPAGGHHEFLSMTCSAGGGNVGVIHPGLGIACRQQLVRAAVAIHTGGSLPVPGLDCLGVIAAVVSRLLIGMALCTVDLGGRGLVGRTFDVGVAVDAGEDAPVHRVLECIGVYVKADLLTICLLSHRRIAVAYEAV